MKFPIFFKLMTLSGIGVLLFIFLFLIQGVIWERKSYRAQAISSIASSYGGPQTILGPMVYQSCTETWLAPPSPKKKDEDTALRTEERRDFILTAAANTLQIKANTQVEPRSLGIHQTNIHNTKAVLSASWDNLNSLNAKAERKDSKLQCDAPVLMLGVTDPQGIRHASLTMNTETLKFSAGTLHPKYQNGLHVKLSDVVRQSGKPLQAEIELEVAGIERFSVVPFAESTMLRMQSNWAHPSFVGRFAPVQRSVTTQGFDASWRISALASNATLGVAAGMPLCTGSDESVEPQNHCVGVIQIGFVEPINAYSLSDRASKYGLLFVVLTFVAVGLFEVMKKLRVHPVQYLLAGAAICTFFLLLVSLSEHIGFASAYAVGASATVLLLTYYASYMLGGKLRGLPFGAGIALLYAFMYVLLQLEQTALVMGSVMLFIALAIVMSLTRKINWYEQFSSKSTPQPTPQVAPEAS